MPSARFKTLSMLCTIFTIAVAASIAGAQDDGGSTTKPEETKPDTIRYVKMKTTKGDIYLGLNETKAPESTKNFLAYVDAKFYDGTIFHRVIPNFMIQGGGHTPDLKRKATQPAIKNEWQNGMKNARGTIAMARTQNPDSATSQFFINVNDNRNLDQPISGGAGYAVFGKVVAGMKAVEAIRTVQTQALSRSFANVPIQTVVIEKVMEIHDDEALAAIEEERIMAEKAAEKEAEKDNDKDGNASKNSGAGGNRPLGKPGRTE